jgi:hypothetical protein
LFVYGLYAKVAEYERNRIVDSIANIMAEEVFPMLSKALPAGYTAEWSDEGCIIGAGIGKAAIPERFCVKLRLRYLGQPVNPFDKRTLQVQSEVRPKLEEIADRYGLSYIDVLADPVVMD